METINTLRSAPRVFGENASRLRKEDVKRILLLYEEKVDFIGDFCMWTGRMHHFRSFFNNASIDLNFSKKGGEKIFRPLLQGNPDVDQVLTCQWEELALEEYDMIWIASNKEILFLHFLENKYGHQLKNGAFKTIVFSFSRLILGRERSENIFPVADEFIDQIRTTVLAHLYVSAEEIAWGNQLLRSRGLLEHEQLFVLVDAASDREKLLNLNVLFEVLTFLLKIPDSKVLVFDPDCIDKAAFYEAWLDAELFDRMIFVSGLELRKVLAILGSPSLKLLLGPCTGLLHCASGIYNHYVHKGMKVEDVPLLITYTGKYRLEGNPGFWWGNAPLVNCLMLKETNDGRQLRLLTDLPQEKRMVNDSLECSEYTAEILINFISSKL